MKKLLSLLLLLMAAIQFHAQQLEGYEYFFNNDPGVGNGMYVAITPTDNYEASINIPTASVGVGYHRLCIRFKDSEDAWSTVQARPFINLGGNAVNQSISAVEVFFDDDPGLGQGTVVPVTATANLNTTVNIIPPADMTGLHQICVRTKNAAGLWSTVQSKNIINLDGNSSTQTITEMEVFFDEEPGVGEGIIVPITPTANLDATINVMPPSDITGVHQTYVRVKNGAGLWSTYQVDTTNIVVSVSEIDMIGNIGIYTYPNPASEQLMLDFDNDFKGKVQMKMLDISGKTVLTESFTKPSDKLLHTIDLSAVATGQYFITLSADDDKPLGTAKVLVSR